MSNVTLNAGSGGATLGTDQVSGVDYQICKIGYSVAGGAPTQVSTTNPLPISDAGGSVTVDGTVSISGTVTVDGSGVTQPVSGTVSAKNQDGAGNALTSAARGSERALSVQIVDGSGAQITAFGGSGGTSIADGASFTRGTTSETPAGGIAETSAPTLSNGKAAALSLNTSGGLRVDGSGVTQPVSAASLPLPTGAATAAKQPALGTAGSASTDVLTIQGIASMTKLLVTPDSVALPANQSVNVSQLAGTTTDTNSGTKSAGTLRVVIATDQPQLTNKLLVTPDANSAINLAQVAGTTTATGNGTASAGCQRITIASDNTAFTTNAAQSGTWTVQPGNTANTTPWLVTDTPATSGGLSFVAVVASAANNNKTQVKGSAGQLYFISAQNLNASPRYLKVFNNTSAGVTAGTTAADFQFLIPGNTAGAGVVLNIDKGIAMGTGITIMVTGAIGATDNTSISANEVTVLVGYK